MTLSSKSDGGQMLGWDPSEHSQMNQKNKNKNKGWWGASPN